MASPASGVAALLLEYDGTGFSGWASQPGRRTVQSELERALAVVLRRDGVALTVAGRTDAGVHACGQVASYVGPPVRAGALNALLPSDAAVVDCVAMPPGFDARRSATSRAYCYRLWTGRSRSPFAAATALHWTRPVDVRSLHACAAALTGTHDFTAFTPTQTHHVRFERDVVRAFWRADGDGSLSFWIEADAFMRAMNRVLVGTMLDVARGRMTVEAFASLLRGAPRSAAGATAPAHGLTLVGVGYGGHPVLVPGAERVALAGAGAPLSGRAWPPPLTSS